MNFPAATANSFARAAAAAISEMPRRRLGRRRVEHLSERSTPVKKSGQARNEQGRDASENAFCFVFVEWLSLQRGNRPQAGRRSRDRVVTDSLTRMGGRAAQAVVRTGQLT